MHCTVVTPTTMLQTVLLSPLVVGAPQYGGGASGGHSAPSQAQTSVQCRTENQDGEPGEIFSGCQLFLAH